MAPLCAKDIVLAVFLHGLLVHGVDPLQLEVLPPGLFTQNWTFSNFRDPRTEFHDRARGRATDGCRCIRDALASDEVICQCKGRSIKDVPGNLTRGVTRLSFMSVSIRVLRATDLQNQRSSLKELFFESVKLLKEIQAGTLHGLEQLRTISIKQAPKLKNISDEVFKCELPELKIVRIMQSALEIVPHLQFIETKYIIYMVDLESNNIRQLTAGSIKMKTEILNLDHNPIEFIEDNAFDGAEIARLSLKGNSRLKMIGDNAFVGLKNIRKIDLSETSISHLPVKGLEELEELRLLEVHRLKVFPSVYHFKYIKEAHLTYPYHCCAFRFPASHDPQEFNKYLAFKEEMEKKFCQRKTNQQSPTTSSTLTIGPSNKTTPVSIFQDGVFTGHVFKRSLFEWGGIATGTQLTPKDVNETTQEPPFFDEQIERLLKTLPNGVQMVETDNPDSPKKLFPASKQEFGNPIEGVFHRTTISVNMQTELKAFCGRLAKNYRDVVCRPAPDAFNPCEDVMGNSLLRVVVWFVVITAVLGNLAVMIVLMATGIRRSVSKFLMCNLAFADFCMGMYLLMIAAMDLLSMGTYFNYAIDWQTGYGCHAAGFLTVFATELSIFTLTVISVERWYAITNAIHLNKRLDLNTAIKVMSVGWSFAVTMASLPLLGINGYTRTSICLPMENRHAKDYVYLMVLLVTNSLAFLFILYCYGSMYSSVIHHQSKATANDMAVAKRMALLVLTDFLCWAPVSFFAVTAVAGYPLIDVTESKILLVFFYPLNSCSNPFLYAILTTQYRRDFLALLKRCDCSSYWTRKRERRSFEAPLQFSHCSRYRSSCSSDNSSRALRHSDVSSQGVEDGLDNAFKLWMARKDQYYADHFSSSTSEECSGCLNRCGAGFGFEKNNKGSPHPNKHRCVNMEVCKDIRRKGSRTTNI